MKLQYTTKDGRMTVEFEGSTQTDVVDQLASFQEVFEDNVCRKNGKESDDVVWRVREVDDNKYYEKYVISGPLKGTKKSYGQHKKGGGLFPKVKDSKGSYLPDNGWVRWNPETKSEE